MWRNSKPTYGAFSLSEFVPFNMDGLQLSVCIADPVVCVALLVRVLAHVVSGGYGLSVCVCVSLGTSEEVTGQSAPSL